MGLRHGQRAVHLRHPGCSQAVRGKRSAEFLGTEDTILYSSCFDANGGLFETLLGAEDAIISDELNHASIIDGVRLCKAERYRYLNNNMATSKPSCSEAARRRFRMIATDGVFSMDGYIANLPAICDLAEKHNALVMVDDSHAVGFMGQSGRGTHEHHGVMGRIDVITGTLGKALGGASGGYTSGRKEIIELPAPALAALPVFEHARSFDCRGDAQGPGIARLAQPNCATSWKPTRSFSAKACRSLASTSCREPIPLCR